MTAPPFAEAASPSPKVLVVIPVFNNRETLRQVVEETLETGLPVLVVNDGNTDGGPDRIRDLAIERIDFAENRGKGAAILAAGEWAETHGFSHVVTLDADGQHDPGDVPRFLPKIRENGSAIVVGRRDFSRADVPGPSRFGRAWSNMWMRIACGAASPDTQSGFRAYPVAALRRVRCFGRRYDFEVEILARSVWAGFGLDSVDVSVRYFREGKQVSHFRPFRDNFRITIAYARLVARNLLPFPHRRLLDLDPYSIELHWAHPIRFWKSVHRRLYRKLDEEEKHLSLRHPIRSLRLLHLERSSPKEISLACMLGVFLGTLPLIGFHTVTIFFYAARLRLNQAVAFYASNLCMPIAPPFVPALAVEVGFYLRQGRFLTLADLNTQEALLRTLGREAHLRLWEYFLGSLVVGPLLAVLVGLLAYLASSWRQGRLRRRREAREIG
jgi:glycosyltransferase involved in cell wall biosynthesis